MMSQFIFKYQLINTNHLSTVTFNGDTNHFSTVTI